MITKISWKKIQGGYSDIRLWPCCMIVSSLMLYLMPQIGTFWSTLLVFTPTFLIAKWVTDRQPIETYDVETWSRDLEDAISKDLPLPELNDYKVNYYKKQPKLRSKKEVRHKALKLKTAIAKS